MKHFPQALALILLLAVGCLAQNSFEAKVDEYIHGEMQTQQIPGLSLAVIMDGRIVLARGYGLANVEHQVPVKPETVFQSGSVGKQFTATAVMMLIEEGKLSLDDTITKYFPDGPTAWRDITVRHLLTHTSGMEITLMILTCGAITLKTNSTSASKQFPLLSNQARNGVTATSLT